MDCYLTTNSLVDATGPRSCYIKKSELGNWIKLADILQIIFNFNAFLSLSVLYVPSSLFELPTAKFCTVYNRIICQRVQNTSFFERLSCILHALAKVTKVTNPISDFTFLSTAKSGKSRIKNPFLDSPKGTHPCVPNVLIRTVDCVKQPC